MEESRTEQTSALRSILKRSNIEDDADKENNDYIEDYATEPYSKNMKMADESQKIPCAEETPAVAVDEKTSVVVETPTVVKEEREHDELQYLNMIRTIIEKGKRKSDRTGIFKVTILSREREGTYSSI